ncbi:hypothetical protein, partial [Cytobacillus oceanisediminis]|uniref:hypothetical protein n=1 Tax=Cytobacillus oceanisediminis TaxID=665099 RepID=UPI001C312E7E
VKRAQTRSQSAKTSKISANRHNNSAKPKQKSTIPIDFGAIPNKRAQTRFQTPLRKAINL